MPVKKVKYYDEQLMLIKPTVGVNFLSVLVHISLQLGGDKGLFDLKMEHILYQDS